MGRDRRERGLSEVQRKDDIGIGLKRLKVLERLLRKTRRRKKPSGIEGLTGDCLIWLGAKHGGHEKSRGGKFRCGSFWYEGSAKSAHGVLWLLTHGPVPDGLQLNHRCGRSFCVNPEHLYLGTQAENVKDMHNHGQAVGRQCGGRLRRSS